MTQPPPRPPQDGGGYAPDLRYVERSGPPGRYPEPPRQPGDYPEAARPPGGYPEPRYLPPPPYPPGQEPLQPRQRAKRRSPMVAPVLAFIGLVLLAGATIWAIGYLGSALDEAAAAEASAAPVDGEFAAAAAAAELDDLTNEEPPATPEPQEDVAAPIVIQAPPGQSADIKGSILFTRSGDIWSASGTQLERLTSTLPDKEDSSPTWTPDGKFIYFIRTSRKETDQTRLGGKYTLTPTDLMRMKPDGSDRKTVYNSLIRDSRGFWFSHVLQPSVSSNGTNVAVVSDGPDGAGPVVLHVVNSKSKRLRKAQVGSDGDLGHNDPAFSPDGTRIAYTHNSSRGTLGAPRIAVYTCQSRSNCSSGKSKLLKPGFANPSWSPDSRFLAVETTTGTGRDIAIVGVRSGDVKVALTDNGGSFAPAFSPDGDQIAYLRRDGTEIDLRVLSLDIDSRGNITLLSDQAVTTDGGLDGASSPSWFIPRDQLTNPEPEVDDGEATDPDGAEATQAPESDDSAADEGAPPPPGS